MIIFAFVAIIAALVCARGLAFVDFDIPPETVSQFDPTAYMGRWYQVYTSLVPRLTYEKNGVCVVADYLNPVVTDSSARFDILNSENLGSPTGKLKQVCGRAVNDHLDDSPGEFRVTFDKMDSLFAGFYWIVRLGEIEEGQSQYPWAIVSVPFQTSLFILARDVDEFKRKYEADALALVRDLGYKYFFNKPLETVHSAECKYPPRPKPGPPKPGPTKPEPPQDPPQPAAETGAEAEVESAESAESVETAEAIDELVEADFEEVDRRLRFLQRDPDKTKRPSSDKTKKPKPPSMRRTKQPNKTKQPKEPKSKPPTESRPPTPGKPEPPPTSGKPEPPPTPSKPEPPPTPSKEKPEPPPTGKPKPPPPPQKMKPPPAPPLFEV